MKARRRWADVQRRTSAEDVVRLRGTEDRTPSPRWGRNGCGSLCTEPYVHTLGAGREPGGQMVQAGLKAIYVHAVGDVNAAGGAYPDQSLYPARQRANPGAADPTTPCRRRPWQGR